jgi:CDP-diacylglycerol--glycerol-3-phosphate 3-phosphatidyltransferase
MQVAPVSLRRQWWIFAGICAGFLGGGAWLLSRTLAPADPTPRGWLLLSGAALFYLLWVLRRNLSANHRPEETALLPRLGPGNWLTLLRGVAIAGLIGFLFAPRPSGWLAWTPAVLYTVAVLADFGDGYVARRTRSVTRLGEILDLSFDGVGVLAAAWLAAQWGQAPWWYLSVALARYAFLAGLAWREHCGLPIYPLPPAISRRAFAGAQMGYLAAALWPIFQPPGTQIAAAVFAAPFLIGFGRDWLWVSGRLQPEAARAPRPPRLVRLLTQVLPLILRAAVIVLGGLVLRERLVHLGGPAVPGPLMALTALEVLAALLLVFGIAGRSAAIVGLLLLGVQTSLAPLTLAEAGLIVSYAALLFVGTGPLSLWTPEDRLIHRRAGEVA